MISLQNTGIDGLDQVLAQPTTGHVRLFIRLRLFGIIGKLTSHLMPPLTGPHLPYTDFIIISATFYH